MKVLDLQGETKDTYFWGAKQDELVACNDNYVLCDHLGSVRKVVDGSGNAVSELQYDAFGQLISATGEKPRFRYTGKMFDEVTELQWNINRWYDPKVGRWCSEDPIGFWASDANLYRYTTNYSVDALDLFGYQASSNQYAVQIGTNKTIQVQTNAGKKINVTIKDCNACSQNAIASSVQEAANAIDDAITQLKNDHNVLDGYSQSPCMQAFYPGVTPTQAYQINNALSNIKRNLGADHLTYSCTNNASKETPAGVLAYVKLSHNRQKVFTNINMNTDAVFTTNNYPAWGSIIHELSHIYAIHDVISTALADVFNSNKTYTGFHDFGYVEYDPKNPNPFRHIKDGKEVTLSTAQLVNNARTFENFVRCVVDSK